MNDLFKWADFAFKALPAIAAVVFLIISSQFVTRGEYLATSEKFSGRVESIEKLLIKMESQAEVDRHQNEIIADHESRIRNIEHIPKS
jgi:hypothetical protein